MSVDTNPNHIQRVLDNFSRTTEEIITLEEFKKLLGSGKQLRLKYGVDVTAPTLHIGHAVNLWMYRELQEMGHKLVFLIGDFTTKIGDPTGRNKTRPVIPEEEIQQNAEKFIEQAKMVLLSDPEVFELRRNSEWFAPMPASELISLLSLVTHNRLMNRDMFQKRLGEGSEIYQHETIYPILQAYDSVMLDSDVTIIGTDQLFNEMLGRYYQEKFHKPSQVIITTKITPGIDGGEKQSKSLGNYIGLTHSPEDKYGRAMSIPDSLIRPYIEVYSELLIPSDSEVKAEPMAWKKRLASAIVERYHGKEAARQAEAQFEQVVQRKEVPVDVTEVKTNPKDIHNLLDLVLFAKPTLSNSEAKRLIEQGGVVINDEKRTDPKQTVQLEEDMIVRIGKRDYYKISF